MPRLATLVVVLTACRGYTLDERTCPFVVHASQVKGDTYRCGYVDMGNATQTRVRVPVLVLYAKAGNKPPFVFLAGGPSQSWTNLGLDKNLSPSAIANSGRDYIFIEQRGTGASEPNLSCLQSDGDEVSCGKRLDSIGQHPADFTTLTLADDIERIRQALGYDTLVLNGTSYGTTWARAALARGGAHIERAVLNSVVSATFPLLSHFASGTDEAFGALFNACAVDANCSTEFPDLEAHMDSTIAALKAKPLVDAQNMPAFDHDDFIFEIRNQLSAEPTLVPALIRLVETAAMGDGKVPDHATDNQDESQENEAVGQYFAVFCADNATVTDDNIAEDLLRVRPALRDTLSIPGYGLRAVCNDFPHASAVFDSSKYVGPVLLLVGAFDPRTPPSWARDAQTTVQRGLLAVAPGQGHDVAHSSDCLSNITSEFMFGKDSPDVACVSRLSIAFPDAVTRQAKRFSLRHRPALTAWAR